MRVLFGILLTTSIMCTWGFAQEFELMIVSQSGTSLRFNETGHVADGGWRTRVVEDMCVGGAYDIDALPVNHSAPDGSTPPLTLPYASYKNQSAGTPQLFGNAGVGQYNVMVTQLAIGNPLCTEGLFFNYTITITQPDLPPPPSTGSDSGTGSIGTGAVGTGDVDENSEEEDSQVIKGGGSSSINSFITQSNQHAAPSFSTQSVLSQQIIAIPEPVCEPKKLIRARVYAIANNFALQNQLTIRELIQLTALKQRYLAKANSPKERNALIEKGFCITDNKQKMLDTGTDVYRKIQGFQDFLLLEYEMD